MRGVVALALMTLGLMNSAVPAQTAASQPARSEAANGVFVWADGSYWSVHLPKYGLGLHNVGAGGTDSGLVQSYDPRPEGAAASGGIGFTLPDGTLNGAFGSNVRVSVGGFYLRATGSQSGAAASFDSVVQTVDGTVILRCALPVACQFSSQLDTKQTAWRTEAKLAGDFRAGTATLTPSIAVLGGVSRTNQTFYQQRDTTQYNARSELGWTDWGAKFEIGGAMPLMTGLAIGVSGNVGVVQRNVSLSAYDFGDNAGIGQFASTRDIASSTTSLIAGAAVELVARPSAMTTLRAFAGLDYDSRVPGIASPSFTPASLISTVGTPAGIVYSGEVSYFAGGGVTVRFAP